MRIIKGHQFGEVLRILRHLQLMKITSFGRKTNYERQNSISDDSRSSSDSDDLDAKRNRTSFSAEQLEQLEAAFSQNTYPNEEEKKIIARDTGLSEEKIMVKIDLFLAQSFLYVLRIKTPFYNFKPRLFPLAMTRECNWFFLQI